MVDNLHCINEVQKLVCEKGGGGPPGGPSLSLVFIMLFFFHPHLACLL